MTLTITLIGGPTALIEIDGFRLLTDPTFDGPGDYQLPHVKLEKLTGPAMSARDVGPIDAVLLSHDQHSDNLDHSGRDFLAEAKRVLTTEAGAKRLGGKTEGFAPWASTELKKGGRSLTVTATPARHGPASPCVRSARSPARASSARCSSRRRVCRAPTSSVRSARAGRSQ